MDPFHTAIRRNHDTCWITRLVHKPGEMPGLTSVGPKSYDLGNDTSSPTVLVILTMQFGEGIILSSSPLLLI